MEVQLSLLKGEGSRAMPACGSYKFGRGYISTPDRARKEQHPGCFSLNSVSRNTIRTQIFREAVGIWGSLGSLRITVRVSASSKKAYKHVSEFLNALFFLGAALLVRAGSVWIWEPFFSVKERLLSYVILGGCRSPIIRRYPQDKVYLFKVGKYCFSFPLLPLPQRTFYFFSCFLYDVLRVSYTKGEVLIMWPMRDLLEIYPVISFTRILVERRQKGGNKMWNRSFIVIVISITSLEVISLLVLFLFTFAY